MDINSLKDKIVKANIAYRSGNPEITDDEYDNLIEKYKFHVSIEEYNSFRDSLNEGIIEIGNKVSHPYIMGSLDKISIEKPDDIKDFIIKNSIKKLNISAKVDGISCRLKFKDGKLQHASTRGDGYNGIVITDKIKYVNGIPNEILIKEEIDIRGELVIFKSDFEKMKGFANPRNACAGIINKKDWNKEEVKNISFVSYTILGETYFKEDQFKILNDNGFKTSWNINIIPDLNNLISDLESYANQTFDYETDGLVICSTEYKNEKKYRPDACIAIKLNTLIAETRLIDIEWQRPSKDGKIAIVGIVEPVNLGGSSISRATLNNLDYINKLGLKYGSKVLLAKRGDIIPSITKVISNENTTDINLLEECPCCGSKLIKDGPFLWCKNKECIDQTTYQVMHFIKKLEVEFASFKTLQNFKIFNINDLLKFSPNKKYKMEVKLYDEIYNKIFTRSKAELLAAMNFQGLSEILINKIIDFYGINVILNNGPFNGLPLGIGEITLNKFKSRLLENLKNIELIVNDSRYHQIIKSNDSKETLKNGMSICFTGKLLHFGRSEASKMAIEAGFEVKNTVTKGLTYLCTNDVNSGSSKNKKAAEFGIKIISEDNFIKLISKKEIQDDIFSL